MSKSKTIGKRLSGLGAGRAKTSSWRPRGWHNWVLGLMCLILIVVGITSVGSASGGPPAGKRTAEVGRGVVQSTVSGNGSLEAVQQVELNFGASGEVTEIYVEAGEEVIKGEVLARVDASSAEASLASAEAQLSEAEEALESASEAEGVSWEGSAESSTVLVAYVENEADQPDEASEAEGQEGDESKGTKPEEGSDENGEKDGEKNAAEEAESPAPAESTPEVTEGSSAPSQGSGGSEEMGAASGGATVSVETAEANVRQARLTVKSASQEVRETTLRAPIGGTIASVSGSVGETVSGEGSGGGGDGSSGSEPSTGGLGGLGSETTSSSSGTSAFIVLAQLNQLKMEVSFTESDIGKVKVGQAATVAVSSLEGTELAGRVIELSVLPSEGSSNGVVEYPATILVTQRARGVRAGMSASAEVVVAEVQNAVTVPSEAITSGLSKTVTVEADGGGEAERTVTTGLVGDESTQVLSGLQPGQTVVLPEATVATGGLEGLGGAEGGFPGGGAIPSGGFPSGGGFPAGGSFPGGGP